MQLCVWTHLDCSYQGDLMILCGGPISILATMVISGNCVGGPILILATIVIWCKCVCGPILILATMAIWRNCVGGPILILATMVIWHNCAGGPILILATMVIRCNYVCGPILILATKVIWCNYVCWPILVVAIKMIWCNCWWTHLDCCFYGDKIQLCVWTHLDSCYHGDLAQLCVWTHLDCCYTNVLVDLSWFLLPWWSDAIVLWTHLDCCYTNMLVDPSWLLLSWWSDANVLVDPSWLMLPWRSVAIVCVDPSWSVLIFTYLHKPKLRQSSLSYAHKLYNTTLLTFWMLVNFSCFCCRLLTFFKIIFFQKILSETQSEVEWFGFRSGLMFCLSWSGSKLFEKVISKWQVTVSKETCPPEEYAILSPDFKECHLLNSSYAEWKKVRILIR